MKRLVVLMMLSFGILFLSGCSAKGINISTCKSYKNGICKVKKSEKVYLCKNPIIVDKNTYCRKLH